MKISSNYGHFALVTLLAAGFSKSHAQLSANNRILDSSFEPTFSSAPSLWVDTSQSDVLFSEVGQTRTVTAQVLDDVNGRATPVMMPVTWRSTNPDVAQVDSSGLITSVGQGAAIIIAEAEGARTRRIQVTTAQVAEGVFIVAPEELLERPEIVNLSETGDLLGNQLQTLLAASVPVPSVGNRLIVSDWSYSGVVTQAEVQASGTLVTFETASLEGAFESLALDYQVPLSEFLTEPNREEPKFANGKDFDIVGTQFSCESESSSGLTITTDIVPEINKDLDFNYEVNILNFATQSARMFLEGKLEIEIDGIVEIGTDFSNSVDCKMTVIEPFYANGPMQIQIPLGVGFTIKPEESEAAAQVRLAGSIEIDGRFGTQFSLTGLKSINEVEVNTDNLDVALSIPELAPPQDLKRVKMSVDVYAFMKSRAAFSLKVLDFAGSVGEILNLPSELAKEIDETKVGVRAHLDVAGVSTQLRESAFVPAVSIEVFAKHSVQDPFLVLKGFLGGIFFLAAAVIEAEINLITWVLDSTIPTGLTFNDRDFALDLGTTPKGVLTTSTLVADQGEEVTLALDLTDVNLLGVYQPVQLEVYELSGDGLNTTGTLFHTIVPASGMTHFEWTWTPDADDAANGFVRLVPFAVTQALGNIPIELDNVETGIQVGGDAVFELLGGYAGTEGETHVDEQSSYVGFRADDSYRHEDRKLGIEAQSVFAAGSANSTISGRLPGNTISFSGTASANSSAFVSALQPGPSTLLVSGAISYSVAASATSSCAPPPNEHDCSEVSAQANSWAGRAALEFTIAPNAPPMRYEFNTSLDSSGDCGHSVGFEACFIDGCGSGSGPIAPGQYVVSLHNMGPTGGGAEAEVAAGFSRSCVVNGQNSFELRIFPQN